MKTVQLTCRKCNGTMSVDQDREVLSCPYCGAKEWIEENSYVKTAQIKYGTIKDVELEKLQFEKEKERRNFKKSSFGTLIVLASVIAIAVYVSIYLALHLDVPDSSSSYIGKNYEDVVYQLKDAGFKNIETMAVGDLADGWLIKADSQVDTIKEISIDGTTDFGKHTSFNNDATVRIFYHTYPETESGQPNQNP